MQDHPLRLELLGTPLLDTSSISSSTTQKAIRLNNPALLFLYLAYRNDWVSRSELAFLFRPDETELVALKHLRLQLHRAKKLPWFLDIEAVEATCFEADKERMRLSVLTDVDEFKTAIVAEEWQTAIELYKAPLFGDYAPADLPTYGAWLEIERAELEGYYLKALQTYAHTLEMQANYEEASGLYAKQLAIDGLAEEVVQAYMRCSYQMGSRDKALKAFEVFTKLVLEEFDAEPLEATQALAKTIQNGDSIASFIDEDTKQETKLSLKTIVKLPKQATRFVGRVSELKQLAKTLEDQDCRVLTLIGLGGSGKTRLSVALAQQQQNNFKDGVYFIALSKVSSATAIITLLAQELAIKLSPRQDVKAQVLKFIEDKAMLLVMDNFEHLLQSSEDSASATALITELLELTPHLKLIITSRERLGLSSEWLVDIEGLNYPKDLGAENIAEYEAVKLFTNSALRVAPRLEFSEQDLKDIARICAKVEGLPLAIELAASWARLMPISRIKSEFDKGYDLLDSDLLDLPEKHRNIKHIFDATWQSLSEVKKTTLTKLSVFSGDFSLEAAEFVSGTHFSILLSLVNESLLKRMPPSRFELHQLLKQYSSELLAKSEEVVHEVKQQHAAFYSQALKDSGLENGSIKREAMQMLRADSANIESAWFYYVETNDFEALNAIKSELFYYFYGQALFSEGLELFSKSRTKLSSLTVSTTDSAFLVLNCSLLICQGRFLDYLANRSEAFDCYEEALVCATEAKLPSVIAQCHDYMGEVKLHSGDVEAAKEYIEKAYSYHKTSENWRAISYNRNVLGNLLKRQGKYRDAKEHFDVALKAALKLDDLMWQANITNNLANITEIEGKYQEAESYYQNCLAVFETIGHVMGIAGTKTNLGFVALKLGKVEEAKQLTSESLDMKRKMGNKSSSIISLINLGEIALFDKDNEVARFHLLEALQIGRDIGSVPLILETLPVLAEVYAVLGEKEFVEPLVELLISHPNSSPPIKARAAQLLPQIEAVDIDAGGELEGLLEQIFLKEHNLENAV